MIATIELTDVQLSACIGEHSADEILPEIHILDLVLTVNPDLACTAIDKMSDVFDYDPVLDQIYRLTKGKRYETQEYLISLIARSCAHFREVIKVDVSIKKMSKGAVKGKLGVRLVLDEGGLKRLRAVPN